MKLGSSKWGGNQKGINLFLGKKEHRILTFFDLIATGLGNSLGVGISVLIGELIKNVTGPSIVVSVFMASVTAFLGGLYFAEFGARFLKVDSVYSYSYFWCEESAAFIFGWALILQFVAGIASVVKGMVTFADALTEEKISDFLKKTASGNCGNIFPYFDYISFTIIIFIIIFTAFRTKDSVIIKKFFTFCNLFLIVSVIIAGIFKAETKNWSIEKNVKGTLGSGFAPFGATGVIKGAAVAFYGFLGFDSICAAGPEVKKRKKNLPIAILATILITLVSFAGIGVILTFMLPYDKLSEHAAVPIAFEQVGWVDFKWVVVVATFFGFQTCLFGITYPLPRIINGMANDGLLFHFLGDSGSKFKTPVIAAVSGGLTAALTAGIFPFQKLVNLTVIAALFVHVIVGVSVIFFRYSQKLDEEKLLESSKMSGNDITGVTIRAMLRNYFNFKEKSPTALTQKITLANVILFCISSVGLSIILIIFYDDLFACAAEALVPAGIFLSVLFFSLISITSQPKSQDGVSFKVPFLPLIPCLGIFLSIFFMVAFESLTWILFSCWMAVGIFSHFIWRLLKWLRGGGSENSLYVINRINAMKLNKSIWKIKSDKKSFYEGTINLGFSDDFEENPNEVKVDGEFEPTTSCDKRFQLKKAEIIQTSESVAEEKTKPLDLNFIHINSAKIVNALPDEEEKVHWECVAEIHTEEEFPQESLALEIVDNTYNFLSEVSEELLKDDSFKEPQESIVLKNKFETTENIVSNSDSLKKDKTLFSLHTDSIALSEECNGKNDLEYTKENDQPSPKENDSDVKNQSNEETEFEKKPSDADETLKKVLKENKNEGLNFVDDILPIKSDSANLNTSFGVINQQKEIFINLIVNTIFETHKNEMILNPSNIEMINDSNEKSTKSNSDEQNKRKEFKEKLNQLLKNQINSDASLTKDSSLSKPQSNETKVKEEKTKDELYSTIKTLNKSQIRGKLEFLLAKGPPKRLSLESSFNLKLKEVVKENDQGH